MRIFLLLSAAVLAWAAGPAAEAKETPAPAAAEGAPAAAYRDAFVAYKSREYAKAADLIDRLLEGDPKNARALVLKGRIVAAQGSLPLGVDTVKQALRLAPSSAPAHRALGDLRFRQRDYAAARLSYLDAQRNGDADPEVVLLLLYCDVGLKETADAQRLFATLNSFDAKGPAYYFAKAALAQAAGRTAEAAQNLQDALLLYGDQVFAQYARDYFFLFATQP